MRQTLALLWLLLCCALAIPPAASAEDLYVADSATNSIAGFQIGSEGLLSPIACAEAALCETEAGPATLAISPNGKYVFVVNRTEKTVSTLAIGSDGSLSKVACRKNCNTASEPTGIATTPNGKYLYVANSGPGNLGPGTIAAFSVGSDGALTKVGCNPNNQCETEGRPEGLAVSPNGEVLYATTAVKKGGTEKPGVVSIFSIGEKGELAPVPCSDCQTGAQPSAVTITPNGKYVYVANHASDTVSIFEVGEGGLLSPVACTETDCGTGEEPEGATASPNGRYLFVSNTAREPPEPTTEPPEPAFVSVFSIGAGGTLSPVECAEQDCETASNPGGVAVSPEGEFLYAANSGAGTISPFSIGLEGALNPIACMSLDCSAGSGEYIQSLAITPDQAPTASFTDAPASAGAATTFDASASTASTGHSVVSYEWNFGDGSSEETTSPSTSHVYATASPYTVTLTVTDSAGCSTEPIFTGQTASCNGSSNAEHTATVAVPSVNLNLKVSLGSTKLPAIRLFGRGSILPTRVKLTLSDVHESAAKWREGKALAHISSSKKRPPIGTRFSFDLSQTASVTFTFFQSLPGRRVTKRCVAPSRHNAHAHSCLRSVLAGTLKLAAGEGLDTLRFYGLLSRHKRLSPGNYTLVLSATSASGVHATTTALHFTIAKPSG
ncbi:MAG TPA: beta-propeller fold lactonase family protein [Solirubrobacteraceae bacterium]